MAKKKSNPTVKGLIRLLSQIIKLKVSIIVLALLFLSIILYFLYFFSINQNEGIWLIIKKIPILSIADASFTTSLIGFAYELIVRHDSEQKSNEMIKELLSSNSKKIIDELPQTLLLHDDYIKSVINKEKYDEIIKKCLQIKSGDVNLGNDLYDGLLFKILSYPNRIANYKNKTTFANISSSFPDSIKNNYFETTVDLSYETTLKKEQFIFNISQNIDEHNKLSRRIDNEYVFLFPHIKKYKKIIERLFRIEKICVNDIELNIENKFDSNGNYEICCRSDDLARIKGDVVEVYYRFVTMVDKNSHMYIVRVGIPTKNLNIELDYANTDISVMNVIDFFVTNKMPKYIFSPSIEKNHKVEIEINEWAFPKGGVAFVWRF